MFKFEQYNHHGCDVWVRTDLKGSHRRHCLCHSCTKFHPSAVDNCVMAQELYGVCVKHNLTTPVFECPQFVQSKRIYMICPVKICDADTKVKMDAYVKSLEDAGHTVHYPPRDVRQDGDAAAINAAHVEAMSKADEVHAWWAPASYGSHFDFGMAYMLHHWFKEIRFVLANDPDLSSDRGYGAYFKALSERPPQDDLQGLLDELVDD